MVRETTLAPSDFIYPLFVTFGEGVQREIPSMPGNFQMSVDGLLEEAGGAWGDGVRSVILFGIPERKDESGSEGWNDEAPVQQAVRALKRAHPDLVVITDVCMCEYTSHGHCGIVRDGAVLNDPTLELLARCAVSHARAGADIVAPSDMMDGRVGAIRSALDGAGFADVPIMAYAAKYASAFYGSRARAGARPRPTRRRAAPAPGG